MSFAQMFSGYAADYDPAKSPADLSSRSTLVVMGRISEIVEGRSYGRRTDSWSIPTISVRIDVSEVKKGSLPKGSDKKIFVEFYATNGRKASQYDSVAPRTSDVLLYLVEAPVRGNATNPIDDPEKGRPQGQPLWRLTTPQGFYLANGRDVTQVQEFEKYEGAGLESFFPEQDRFPADPQNEAE